MSLQVAIAKRKHGPRLLVLFLVVATGVTVLLAASNTGFKIRKTLYGGSTGAPTQWVSIPYRSPYATADDLVTRVMNGSGMVTRYLPTTPPTFDFWTGSGGTNFPLVAGEGYQLAPTAIIEAVIVGSHDSSVVVPASGFSANVDYLIAIPYHSTADTADDLLSELPAPGTITRGLPTTPPTYDFWSGSSSSNFTLQAGEAYSVRLIQNAPGFVPAHY